MSACSTFEALSETADTALGVRQFVGSGVTLETLGPVTIVVIVIVIGCVLYSRSVCTTGIVCGIGLFIRGARAVRGSDGLCFPFHFFSLLEFLLTELWGCGSLSLSLKEINLESDAFCGCALWHSETGNESTLLPVNDLLKIDGADIIVFTFYSILRVCIIGNGLLNADDIVNP